MQKKYKPYPGDYLMLYMYLYIYVNYYTCLIKYYYSGIWVYITVLLLSEASLERNIKIAWGNKGCLIKSLLQAINLFRCKIRDKGFYYYSLYLQK